MRDTRVTNMRECLNEAITATQLQVLGLLRDVQKVMDEFRDEGVANVHDRIDLEQAQVFITAAYDRAYASAALMRQAVTEYQALEWRA